MAKQQKQNGGLVQGNGPAMGKRGLHNLGNTCFMNSIIQCLSHTKPLTSYFLTGEWNKDLNVNNPLGFNGKIAKGWHSLLMELWHGSRGRAVDPRNFKRAVSRLAQGRFSGFQQHDSQEMLTFLLDGLHEDTNKILKKPYVEERESNDLNESDLIIAQQMWDDYQLRNLSIVTDRISGQYKSTLKCPQCDRVSVKFDPFQYVTLSLPSNNVRKIIISVLRAPTDLLSRADGYQQTMTQHVVHINTRDKCLKIKEILSKKLNVNIENWTLMDVFKKKFFQIFHDTVATSEVRTTDAVLAIEAAPVYSKELREERGKGKRGGGKRENSEEEDEDEEKEMIHLSIYHMYQDDSTGKNHVFGLPLLLSTLHETMTFGQLKLYIIRQLQGVGMASIDLTDEMIQRVTVKIVQSSKNNSIRKDAQLIDLGHEELTDLYFSKEFRFQSKKINFITMFWDEETFNQLLGEEQWEMSDISKMGRLPQAGSAIETLAEREEAKKERNRKYDLHGCFNDFSKPETLDRDNLWYCSVCQEHVQATKTLQLMHVPEILIIQLKRFEWNNQFFSEKINTVINYPLNGLDMSQHCINQNYAIRTGEQKPIYDLYAVSNHFGRMGFGHYTAHCRDLSTDGTNTQWYTHDDASCQPCSESDVVSQAGYVLFYQLRKR